MGRDAGSAQVGHEPCLFSDNGSCHISGDLAAWLTDQKVGHDRGAPFHLSLLGQAQASSRNGAQCIIYASGKPSATRVKNA